MTIKPLQIANHYSYMDYIPKNIMEQQPFSLTELDMAGGRYAAKTASVIRELIKATLVSNERIQINAFRYNNKDLFNLWIDIINVLRPWLNKAYINNTKYIIRLKNTEWRLHSLNGPNKHDTQLTGLSGANSEYLIDWLEEAHQFDNKAKNEIAEASRGAKHKLTITTTNPWSLRSEHIAELNATMPFNEKELITKGYQQRVIGKRLIDYTNWRVNELLRQPDYDQIQKIIKQDPIRARIVDIGMPGIEKGAIFTTYLRNVRERPPGLRPNRLTAGIDLGYVKDLSTCILTGIGGRFISAENEMAFDNTTANVETNYKVFTDIVLKWLAQEQARYHGIKSIEVKVDSENLLAPVILNERARELNLHSRIQARPSKKLRIAERTTALTELMGKGQFYLSNLCNMLLRDMELATWDTTSGTLKRMDPLGEHYLNGAEYSWDNELAEILQATREGDAWLIK